MPPPVSQKNKAKKSEKRGGIRGALRDIRRFTARRGKELEDIVTGIPAGGIEAARAIDRALPRGPLERGDRKHNDSALLRALARQMAAQTYEDIRHPTRNPTSTALTALGLLTFGAGTAVRGAAGLSAASKTKSLKAGAKAATSRKRPTRSFAGIPKKPGQFPKRYTVTANPNALARLLRGATLDPLYEVSRTRAVKGKRGGGYAIKRERKVRELQARMYKQSRGYEPDIETPASTRGGRAVREALGAPMNAVRLSMYVRPRYMLQNFLGTAALLASQQGGHLPTSIRRARKLKKEVPETMRGVRGAMGSTGAKALSSQAAGPGTKLTRKVANVVGKPEEYMRDLAFIDEAAREGITTPAQFTRLIANANSQQFKRIAQAANETVIDYARLGPGERQFTASQLPIFYPMTKGFTRYAGQFPTHHSVQSALLAQLGRQGNEAQDESLGGYEPPPWAPYMLGAGDDRTLNPQNIYQFSPGMDVLRQAAQSFAPGENQPGLNITQQLGPLPQLIYAAATGKELESGFPTLKKGEEATSPFDRALQGFAETSLPFGDIANALWGFGRKSKTYEPMTLQEQLLYNTIGPALFPRRTRMKELRRQSKQAAKRRKQRKY